MSAPSPPHDDDFDTAAHWVARSHAPDWTDAEAAELETWLAGAPARRAAHRAALEAWSLFEVDANDPMLEAARGRALAAQPEPAPLVGGRALPRRRLLIAAGAMAAAVGGVVVLAARPDTQIYATTAAPRTDVVLKDGSRISLDANTRLRVAMSWRRRNVEVQQGQALFHVHKDADRPFVVRSGVYEVTATGTLFNVDRLAGDTTVTLLEGGVTVSSHPSGDAATAIALWPGQQVRLGAGRPVVRRLSRGEDALAWRNGQLLFEDQRLADVIPRVNRYARAPVSLADAGLGDLRLTGVFRTGDTVAFAHAVAASLPVAAEPHPDGGIVLRRRAP